MDILKQPIPISIILCSRQRVESLRALLDSLAENCKNPISYEVLIAGDKDDLDTFKFYEWKLGQTQKYLNCRFRFEERIVNLHYRLNKLTTIGRGKFFWVLNDDCLIETKNWDKIIIDTMEAYLKDKPDRIACGNIKCNSLDKIGDYSAFPVITKEAVKAVGFFMPDSIRVWGADYYIHELYKSIDRGVSIPDLVVNHFLHSSEAAKYENPLRKEILEWHKTNNVDLLGDLKLALHHMNGPRQKLLSQIA
jgi:hypothetical protein